MKRIIAIVLLVCLLFCGCDIPINTPTDPAGKPIKKPASSMTDPTQTPAESVAPDKVTVYLLDKTVLYDSGYTQYHYDENYNIIQYEVFTIEDDLMYTGYYENKDANGMPGKHRTDWDSGSSEVWNLTWSEDGKLMEEQYDGAYTGYQFEYDQAGKLVEKREYYQGELFATVWYEYDGEVLQRIHCTDTEGKQCYVCLAENGHIVEKIYYEWYPGTAYEYKYDNYGNLDQSILHDGEYTSPSEVYSYKAVEVDSDRAEYLLAQQRYLLSSDLEYTWPNKPVQTVDQPETTEVTVEQLREQLKAENKSFAVAYLGYMTYDYETMWDFIDSLGDEVLQKLPFLNQIPETNMIANASQGEVYCFIPTDSEAVVEIYNYKMYLSFLYVR